MKDILVRKFIQLNVAVNYIINENNGMPCC